MIIIVQNLFCAITDCCSENGKAEGVAGNDFAKKNGLEVRWLATVDLVFGGGGLQPIPCNGCFLHLVHILAAWSNLRLGSVWSAPDLFQMHLETARSGF